ncbi:DUF2800 domain-containing protein [[Clostridium] scindens]|uniref:DUF2800 domain-containing protein n=1 Tax=Clostridium scindens (strain JCM 10418 / VPI 12708) TaxID=29347 RepID=UPI00241FCD1D|nr:DUF2800 domain-containing protein [[Clostridium] scindens]
MEHEKRDHALLSASGAHRWLACPPSAKLEEQFPDTTSDAAREGTLAHELAELKVRNYFYTTDFGKRKLNAAVKKLQKEDLWQDEMMGYTDQYLDYIRVVAMADRIQGTAEIEKKVDFGRWVPGGFGTADCLLLKGNQLHVIDFKYGKGVPVSAEENPQMMLYALGARDMYGILYHFDEFHLHIIQPRIDNVSEWTCTEEELLEFGSYVKERSALAIDGAGEFCPGESQCRFCRARSRCAARAEHNVKLAFSPDLGKKPPLISNGQMGEYLRLGAGVAKWLAELKDCALAECLAGNEVPGWKAVEGRSTREWTDMDAAFEVLEKSGVAPEEMLWERKPLTLAQVEKMVGKRDFQDAVGSYVAVRRGKPALVQEADSREAITNKITAEEAFKEEK